jgi:hypothetical protein
VKINDWRGSSGILYLTPGLPSTFFHRESLGFDVGLPDCLRPFVDFCLNLGGRHPRPASNPDRGGGQDGLSAIFAVMLNW